MDKALPEFRRRQLGVAKRELSQIYTQLNRLLKRHGKLG